MKKVFNGAIARIVLRYGVGLTLGMEAGKMVASDADLVMLLAAGVGVATETGYVMAKRKGWVT